ncbi:MAG: hypothetical protein BroJett003_18190 [Planctomycetota bacterium]|nr:MAG: hypothetical protein BroJett003_18190 [Planctomycetota bacterium]
MNIHPACFLNMLCSLRRRADHPRSPMPILGCRSRKMNRLAEFHPQGHPAAFRRADRADTGAPATPARYNPVAWVGLESIKETDPRDRRI